MAERQKIQIHIAAAIVVVCLIGWIVMLYIERYQKDKSREQEFMSRYHAVLNDVMHDLGQFDEAGSFEEQRFCLEEISDALMQLKACMEMHINLISISMPEAMLSEVNMSGWHDVESTMGFIDNGGTINSYRIEAFGADGVISEDEAAVIQFLNDEIGKLYYDMMVPEEDGGNYRYMISSVEVYQRLTEITQDVKAQLIQINQEP